MGRFLIGSIAKAAAIMRNASPCFFYTMDHTMTAFSGLNGWIRIKLAGNFSANQKSPYGIVCISYEDV